MVSSLMDSKDFSGSIKDDVRADYDNDLGLGSWGYRMVRTVEPDQP